MSHIQSEAGVAILILNKQFKLIDALLKIEFENVASETALTNCLEIVKISDPNCHDFCLYPRSFR